MLYTPLLFHPIAIGSGFFLFPLQDMNPGWEMIYCTAYLHLAELAKGLLEHNGIICVLKNKQDSSYRPIGEIELYVRRDDLVKAKYILNHNGLE